MLGVTHRDKRQVKNTRVETLYNQPLRTRALVIQPLPTGCVCSFGVTDRSCLALFVRAIFSRRASLPLQAYVYLRSTPTLFCASQHQLIVWCFNGQLFLMTSRKNG